MSVGRLILFTDVAFGLDDPSRDTLAIDHAYQVSPEEITGNFQSVPSEELPSETHSLLLKPGIAFQRQAQTLRQLHLRLITQESACGANVGTQSSHPTTLGWAVEHVDIPFDRRRH